jgi:ABC-type bacteriocin/lantibiotic exporter with double-glycine peptidase domain
MGRWASSSSFALQQIKTIKASGLEENVFNRFASGYAQNISIEQEIEKKDSFLTAIPVLLQGLVIAGLLLLGTRFVIGGELTIGMLASLEILLLSFLNPINRLVNFGMRMQELKVDIHRLNDVLQYEIDPIYKNKNKKVHPKKLEGRLEFQNVSFGYNPNEPALIQDLSFTIETGQKIALVGPSGVGKSTIAKLALGLYRPWKGEILYDGKPIDELSHESLHHSMSSVDQTIFLFSGTIRENLSLWDPSVTDQMLVEAAKDAKIHEEILSRKGGYDAKLYENGDNLSSGQKQQLEIARALLYRPSLLILDEATSALDPQTEKEIVAMIRQKGVSKLMITQRIASIQDCDEILVLEHGKVVERGRHQELLAAGGLYQKLYTSEGA